LRDPAFAGSARPLERLMHTDPVVAHPAEPLQQVVARMADTGLTSFPVVQGDEGDERGRLLGMVALQDLLRARERQLADDRTRERWLRVRFFRGDARAQAVERAAD
jgi:CBS domain-containing protein